VYSLDVSETTSRGTKIGDILAVDEDEGVNGVVAYSVISDWANDVFNVDPHTGAFSLTGKLDYEEVSGADLRATQEDPAPLHPPPT